jgi:hypothetical protein
LNITKSNASVTISWPLFAQDFLLEQSPVGASFTWSNAPYAFATNAAGITATAPIIASGSLFRLRK